MADRTKALLTERGLACFGMVARSVTHEINNVLATVNEISGLLDDYLAAAEQGAEPDFAKWRALEQRIGKQVRRGENYVRQLNGFAHTMDHPREILDLGESLAQMVSLCQRFARLRKVTLSFDPPDHRFAVEGSAFEVQHLAFRCLELSLVATPPGSTIVVRLESEGEALTVAVAGSDPVQQEAVLERMEAVLAMLVGMLGGRLDRGVVVGRPLDLAMSLPKTLGSLWSDADEG